MPIDAARLREEIQAKYAEVAIHPEQGFRFPTGRTLAERLGYDLKGLPPTAVDAFAGVGNPLAAGPLVSGQNVVEVGCGAGVDSLLAALQVGPTGQVVAVDMTVPMLAQLRRAAAHMGLANVTAREGLAEALPVDDGWADVVLSNGVINLCPDKAAVFAELRRILAPGGRLQMADILVGQPVSEAARSRLELWTG